MVESRIMDVIALEARERWGHHGGAHVVVPQAYSRALREVAAHGRDFVVRFLLRDLPSPAADSTCNDLLIDAWCAACEHGHTDIACRIEGRMHIADDEVYPAYLSEMYPAKFDSALWRAREAGHNETVEYMTRLHDAVDVDYEADAFC